MTFDQPMTMDLGRLPEAFKAVDIGRAEWIETDRRYRADSTRVSARRFDEQKPAGTRTYIEAKSLITGALEHLDVLRRLMETTGLTPLVPHTITRAAFEASAWTIWMLEPPDSVERRRRGLQRACEDHRQFDGFRTVATSRDPEARALGAEKSARVRRIYEGELAALGMTYGAASRLPALAGLLSSLETLRDAFREDAYIAEVFWRGLSGINHGHTYASQALSDVRVQEKIEGGSLVTLHINDTQFQATMGVTVVMLLRAMHLFSYRTDHV